MGLRWNTRRNISKSVNALEPFRLDNIRAITFKDDDSIKMGRLPQEWAYRLKMAQKPIYVVYSYETPIAWNYDSQWTIPDETYSVTTTHHQSVIKVAISTNCYQ